VLIFLYLDKWAVRPDDDAEGAPLRLAVAFSSKLGSPLKFTFTHVMYNCQTYGSTLVCKELQQEVVIGKSDGEELFRRPKCMWDAAVRGATE
jgi:hypothetical protein